MIHKKTYNQTKYGAKRTVNACGCDSHGFTWIHSVVYSKIMNKSKTYYGMVPWTVRTNV